MHPRRPELPIRWQIRVRLELLATLPRVTTWISRLEGPTSGAAGGMRVAVKDAIDVAGAVTTVGCPQVAETAAAATSDAECLLGLRRGGARMVGKANLHELCFGASGINPYFGTPVNPLAPERIPGGSSSGSAVAVAAGEADVGLGTDTGGSVRIPAACCGIVGLKTTWGRVSTVGTWPLAPSLDTIGPLARDVAAVGAAMALVDPSWRPASAGGIVGRVRRPGVDPAAEVAVDHSLALAEFEVVEVDLDGWETVNAAFGDILLSEFWHAHHDLLASGTLSSDIADGLRYGSSVTESQLRAALAAKLSWQTELARWFQRVDVLALPTLVSLPPTLDASDGYPTTALTSAFNLSGNPAVSLPAPVAGRSLPASVQLVGPLMPTNSCALRHEGSKKH